MLSKFLFLFFAMTSFSAYAVTAERHYVAMMAESQWELTSDSPTLCKIEHTIPRFGKVVFSQASARELKLEVFARQPYDQGIDVEFRSDSTSWNSQKNRATLGRLRTLGGKNLFNIPTAIAERAFFELRDGFDPGFYFSQESPLVATISTVRFADAATPFSACVDQLYEDNFNDIGVAKIHFESDNEFPVVAEERNALQRLTDYLAVDPAVSEVVVSGHADASGGNCYNDRLSSRRAWYVYDLLVARGVDPKKIRLSYFGERQPEVKGSSSKAKAANRRVTVKLVR